MMKGVVKRRGCVGIFAVAAMRRKRSRRWRRRRRRRSDRGRLPALQKTVLQSRVQETKAECGSDEKGISW